MRVEFSIQLSEDPENSVSLLLKLEIFTDHHLRHQERATANDLATAAEQIPKGQVWWRSWWLKTRRGENSHRVLPGPNINWAAKPTWNRNQQILTFLLRTPCSTARFATGLFTTCGWAAFGYIMIGNDWKSYLFLMTKDLWIRIVIPVKYYCNYADLFSFPAHPLGSRESSWWTHFLTWAMWDSVLDEAVHMRPPSSRQTYEKWSFHPGWLGEKKGIIFWIILPSYIGILISSYKNPCVFQGHLWFSMNFRSEACNASVKGWAFVKDTYQTVAPMGLAM